MAGEFDLGDLGGVLGGDLYNNLFGSMGYDGGGDGYNFSGDMSNPWMEQMGFNEGGNANWGFTPTQTAMDSFKDYSFNWQPQGGQAGLLTAFDPQGNTYGTYQQKDEDNFTKLMGMVAPMVATGGFGGALSGMFGGGFLGGAAGHGLASGTMSAAQGGDFGKGLLSGAVSGGMQGLNASGSSPASVAGIESPTLAKMFNRGVGGTLGGLVSGASGSDALKSGLTGAGLSGINSLGKNAMDFFGDSMKSWLTPDTQVGGDAEFDALQGSGGDMSGQTDVSPNRYDEFLMGSDGMETYNPDYGFAGDQGSNMFSGAAPDQSTQFLGQPQFSLPSVFGNAGRSLGNFAMNNAGDLASMLYGFYNNRRQQKALQQPMQNATNQVNQATTQLQNMFTQNSPYAQQLRNKLNAQAAATGRRSNTAGRETQFQAMLAEKAASTLPQIANMQSSLMDNTMRMNQQAGALKNNNMNMLLQGFNKIGGFKALGNGLSSLFGSNNPYQNFSQTNNNYDYNSLGMEGNY